LSQNSGTNWSWTAVRSDLAWKALGNQFMVRVPRASLGLGSDPVSFDFHWADNFQTNDISGFFLYGDSAPDRRFNYRYETTARLMATLCADDFEGGKQAWWAESWVNDSKWSTTSATSYSANNCVFASTANGTGNSSLITRLDTSALETMQVSFRYKLHNVADAQNLNVQYWNGSSWITIRELSRDQFYPVGQAWGYDERQDVWLRFSDARPRGGTNAVFFRTDFALRVDATGVNTSGQSVWVDDFLVTGDALPANQPPVLKAISDRVIYSGQPLVVTNVATDPDLPPQTLAWSLLAAPSGATINTNGILYWRPVASQPSLVTSIQVKVADSGIPSLSATQSFWLTVNPPPKPGLASPQLQGGNFQFLVTNAVPGPDYLVQSCTNLSGGQWLTLWTTNVSTPAFELVEPVTATPSRFFRVLLGP
jgi:hypothetical protein